MRKIFTLFAAFAVAFSATALSLPATKTNKQKVAPKHEQVSEWQKAAMSWGNKAKAAKSNSLLQGVDLSNNTLPSFTALTLPSSSTITWNPVGTVIVPDFDYTSYAAMGFTFTVAEGRGVNIAFSGANVACVLSSSQVLTGESQIKVLTPKSSMPIKLEPMAVATPANANWTSEALSAGTYTLFVVYYGSDTPSFLLSVQDADPVQLKSYTEIDYSAELKPGKKVYGMLGDGEGELLDPASLDGAPFTPYAKGYTIEVEQGKFYSLHFENYSNNYYDYRMRVDYNRMFAYVLTGDDLSGDFFHTDMLVSDEDILNDGFVAPVSGKVRLLLMLPQEAKSVVYTMELEEVEKGIVNFTELEMLPMPMCYEVVSFAHDKSFYFDYGCYIDYEWASDKGRARGFKFTLDGEYSLDIYARNEEEDWGPSKWLYSDEDMNELLAYADYSGTLSKTLTAGTYYLVLCDDNYEDYYGANYENYFCYLKINVDGITIDECQTFDEKPGLKGDGVCDAISLEELFDNATPVTYISDLIYADAGTLSCSEAFLVEGLSDGDGYYEKFCRAYKVSLKANDKLYIYNHTSNDAYLYLYALEEGDPTQVEYNDDGGYDVTGIGHDSYIEFTAETAGDYYIVPTTYDGSSVEDFFVVISAVNPEELDLEITALNASAKSIYVEDVNNKGEILVKLSELKIKGTVLGANLLLDNSVDSWLLSADRTTATFILNDEMYAFAEDVEPIVITIVPGSGIYDAEGDANLSVYAANGVINILGTQGGEDVAVYNVMGSKIAAVKATAEITTVNIPCAGVYVVRVGNKSFKVIGQ
ncbi:MAG: hypothetical protein E7076_01075 [Bacteroidales bacterium]|nr:hypothetical protein [Bacteroidales bacterium]